MPKRYLYPGTDTLKNRFGIKDAKVVSELEYASVHNQLLKPVPGFSADMEGLKATHKQLFGAIYEWAGKTRGETVTIDGETFKPEDHILSKGDTQFGPASLSESGLPNELARQRKSLDELHSKGTLTKEKWAELTADQIGMANHAHPFREGNGRTMRRFIELSAEQYGFRARIPAGNEWVKASSEAMAFDKTQDLQALIERNSTEATQRGPKDQAAKRSKEADMAEATTSTRDTTATTLRKAATVTAAASKAVAKIKDPKRRAEAQNLLDNMRKSEATLLKAQRQGKDQDRSTTKPEAKQPAVRRDRDQDYER